MAVAPGILNFLPGGVIWDPFALGPNMALSGSNLIATMATSSADQSVRCTVGKSAGKWYWEIKITGGSGNGYNIGIMLSSMANNIFLGGASGAGSSYTFVNFVTLGFKFSNGVNAVYGGNYSVLNTIVGVAFDATGGTIEMFINNVSQGVMYTGISGTYYPAVGSYSSNTFQYTAHFAAASFTYTPPAGFIALTP